ncbi:hypothetical protein IWX90DRAFT_83667 [Phyllosticta citrichinensis]|uniref:Uncharacterized protein n=1 Tax=Phyllosticta citrichinensis TaxID=1130410 RepID=A0ABR1XFM6_9PEZI
MVGSKSAWRMGAWPARQRPRPVVNHCLAASSLDASAQSTERRLGASPKDQRHLPHRHQSLTSHDMTHDSPKPIVIDGRGASRRRCAATRCCPLPAGAAIMIIRGHFPFRESWRRPSPHVTARSSRSERDLGEDAWVDGWRVGVRAMGAV